MRGGAVGQRAGLIIRRSEVRVLFPLQKIKYENKIINIGTNYPHEDNACKVKKRKPNGYE